MVQISSAFLSLLLIVPTLAAPITFEVLETREPGFFRSVVKDIKKVATPKNIRTAARVASILFRREDGGELTERDVQGLSTQLEDLVRREPNFGSFLHKVKKVATPHNIKTVAHIVGAFVRRELPENMPHLVTRDLSSADDFEELLAREPNFRSFMHKVKKVATPHNIRTVANIVGSFVRRELSEDEMAELVTRSLLGDEGLEDLLAREPSDPAPSHGHHGHSHHGPGHHGPGHQGRHHRGEGSDSNNLGPRGFEEDVSDLEAREPHGNDEPHSHKHGPHKKAGAHGPHHHHRSKHHQSENLQARELGDDVEDILSREGGKETGSHPHGHHHQEQHHPRAHAHGHGHGHGAHAHHSDLVARDLYYAIDELD